MNTEPQPEDNRRSKAVSLIFRGFTANYVSVKKKNTIQAETTETSQRKTVCISIKEEQVHVWRSGFRLQPFSGSYKSYKKTQHVFKNNPDLNSVVLCCVCVSWQLQMEETQLKF